MIEVGECEIGYHGALCSSCLPGYARADKYKCGTCPDPIINLLRIIGVIIIAVFVIGFLVRNTLTGATKKNIHSVY